MRKETSAGGVVLVGNAILLLKKYNGDWVLPKGRVKESETIEQAALREVCEESGTKGEILFYLGSVTYMLNSRNPVREKIEKTVHWYLMKARNMDCIPQRKEGFVDAKYIPVDKVESMARYNDEKVIIRKAVDYYKQEHGG